jgi:hypothetical protein
VIASMSPSDELGVRYQTCPPSLLLFVSKLLVKCLSEGGEICESCSTGYENYKYHTIKTCWGSADIDSSTRS